jgi:hypothetical protein
LISTSRHITQGIVDVKEEKQDNVSNSLLGTSDVKHCDVLIAGRTVLPLLKNERSVYENGLLSVVFDIQYRLAGINRSQ